MNRSSSSIEDILPLSPMQKGILAHSLRPEATSTYVIAAHIRWQGKLHPQAFEGAWRDLAERHVALRSLFVWEGVREPVAVVTRAETLKMPVKVLDLRANPPSVEALEMRVLRAYQQGFDLSSAPLTRHILVRTDDDAWSWIWVHHHLIVDGWCLPILLKEFFARYQERVQGQAQVPVEVASVRDYIKWTRGRSTQGALEYWKGLLGSLSLPTPLPLDRQSADASSPVAAHEMGVGAVHGALTASQAQALRACAAKLGVTINTLFQAAWALTLRAYSGQKSPVFGMTYSGRVGDWPGLANVVSVCIDTVPFRVDIAPDCTVQDWVQGLLDQAQRAQNLAPVGMGAIRELCQGQPFESIVVFENYPLRGLFEEEKAGFRWELVQPRPGGPLEARIQERNNFPLTLVVDPGSQGDAPLSWILAYRRMRFDEASMQEVSECLLEYLQRIMQASASTPLVNLLHTVSIPAKQHTAGPKSLQDPGNWLFTHAKHSPHKLALVAGEQSLSYGQLEQAVLAATQELKVQGIRVGDRVGVDLSCGAQWMVSICALLACGAAYVPVDPSWPKARKAQVFSDAQARWVIRDTPESGQDLRAEPWLEGGSAQTGALPSVRTQPVHPGSLPAYLIYTSGSSGQPKGVVVPREALASYCESLIERLSLQAEFSFAFVSSPGSDLGHTCVFAALALGGTLHWIDPSTALNAQAFGDYNQTHQLDVVKVTPSQLGVWLDCEEPARVLPARHLISGGEVMPALTAQRIFEHASAPDFALWNHYGPTETTVGVCVSRIEDPHAPPFPIGTALAHAHCEVVGPQGLGHVNRGELWIGGSSVAQGYWQRPRETALRFLPDPFSRTPGARVYASGDDVRRFPSGAMLFMGRIDEQVSIRGHRVEPLEIEAVLSSHPQLRQVAVVARKEAHEERHQLWAFVICENGAAQVPHGLQSWAAQCLPEAMVPQRFVALERFALLANGKVDKAALTQLPAAAPLTPKAAPRALSELESLLLGVFQEVLGNPEFDVQDNLFSQGGDSIHSLRIAGRVKKMGHPLTPQMIFEEPCVAQLAARLEGQRASAAGLENSEPHAKQAKQDKPAKKTKAKRRSQQTDSSAQTEFQWAAQEDPTKAPLLPSQRHFFAQAHPESSHFNLSFTIDLPKPPGDVPKAWAELVRRHPSLSVAVDSQGQRLGGLPQLLLRHAHPHEFPALWESLQQSLDPENGEAFKAVWIQGAKPMVWMIAHHLVMDVVSAGILREEFLLLLGGQSLPESGPSGLDWARRLSHYSQVAFENQESHWEHVTEPLRGQSAMPVHTQADATLRRLVIDPATTQRWRGALDSKNAYQWDTLVLTAWADALMRVGGEAQVLFECEGHGRSTEALDLDTTRSVGWLTVRYPVRIDRCAGSEADLFLEVQKALLATPQGGIGYAQWRDAQGQEDSQIGSPYFCYNHLGDLGPRVSDLMQIGQRSELSRRAQWIEVTSFLQEGELIIEWRDAPNFAPPGWEQVDLQACFEDMKSALTRCVEARLSGDSSRLKSPAPAPEPSLPAGFAGQRARVMELLAGIEPSRVQGLVPCNAAQAGIWAACRRAGESAAMYWNHSEWELNGVELARLSEAFSILMQRHEVLRSRWIGKGLSSPLMVVLEEAPLPLRVVDALPEVHHSGLPSGLGWELCVAQAPQGRLRCRWSRHHMLLDGWSHGLLFAELIALVEGQRLAPNAPSYASHLRWLAEQDLSEQDSFWRQTLAGVEPCVTAPFADPVLGHKGYRSTAFASQPLPQDLGNMLQSAAKQCAVTVQTLAQGTFALWLSRAWGRVDPVFAVADAGRSVATDDALDAQSMVGMMMRVLPFVMPRQAPSVGEYLVDVQRTSAKLRAHGDLGMSKIQSLAHAAQQGLCSVLWIYENYPMASRAPDWISTQENASHHGVSTDFALVWVVEPGALGQAPRLSVNYDPSVYEASQVDALMRSYCELLRSMIAAVNEGGPQTPMATFSLAAEPDNWAYTPASSSKPSGDTIASRFAKSVARFPDAEAMSDAQGSRWTYRELDQEVSRAAAALRARGVRAEQAVGLCLSPDADLVIAMLAILRAGGYYVPIDPSTPSARIAEMLHGVQARWVIVADEDPAYAGDASCEALWVSQLRSDDSESLMVDDAMADEVHPSQLAYLIYTSGSTGRPKGVGVEHRNAIRLFDVAQERMSFGPQDAWSLLHRHAFDFSVWEIFGPLLSGGTLVIVPTCERREPMALLKRLARHEISMLSLTPSALIALQRGILSDATLMGSLRYIVLGGEALDVRHLDAAWQAQDQVALINMYGITETTVHVTSTRVSAAAPATGSLVGPPLPDLSLAALDTQGHLLPRGVAGELFVGGQGVSRGYMGQARLTAQRFVPDPLGEPGSRRYRTGDRGQLDAQGQWRHEGRLDQQVQIRGHRIELGEIEARLLEHSAIQAARVLACPAERSLWAYLVTLDGGPIDVAQMREFLGQWLPDYMVPREFMVVENFVRTANGKLDRSVLPTPDQRVIQDQPLQSPTQKTVAKIWSEVLEVPVQGRNADFFELGGQSMAAMRVCDEVQRSLGKTTPIAKVFELPRLEDFARWLDEAPASAAVAAPIKKRRRGGAT